MGGPECLCVSCVGPAALCVGRFVRPLLSAFRFPSLFPATYILCMSFTASAAVLSHT